MEIEPLVLDWNIEYELALNNGSPIEPTLLFLIPVKNQIVYMKLPFYKNEFSEGHVLLLDPVKFISVWRNSKNDSLFPGYHQGNEQM